jgi:hypothetical protein
MRVRRRCDLRKARQDGDLKDFRTLAHWSEHPTSCRSGIELGAQCVTDTIQISLATARSPQFRSGRRLSEIYRPNFEELSLDFDIVGPISSVEVIAVGTGIRILPYLRKIHGSGRWRKLKGVATVRLPNGALRRVELHWFEAHGIGKRDVKIKRYLD